MTSEYSDSAASVTVTGSASPWRDPSDYLSWTSTGRSYHLKMQSTWLRGIAVSDNIQCRVHLSDTGIYLLNSFQTSRFWHLVKFPSMCPQWLNANLFWKAQLQIHETVFSVFPTVWTAWFLETFFPSFSFVPLISFGKCMMVVTLTLCTYSKWHYFAVGTWISIDSFSIGKHPISLWYQHNKYGQSTSDKWNLWIFYSLVIPLALRIQLISWSQLNCPEYFVYF